MEWLEELTQTQLVFIYIYCGVVFFSVIRHICCSIELRWATFLEPQSNCWSSEEAPLLSIIVPAKDEEDTIESCLRSLLLQDYPNLEVVAVNDRSNDRTGEIIDQLASEDARIRYVEIKNLPNGWLGKCNALEVGQSEARGEWLLFVDADTNTHESMAGTLMCHCRDNDLEMLSFFPTQETKTFWEGVVQPFASAILAVLYPLKKMNDPRWKNGGFANGQFVLVTRDGYERLGTHESVKDEYLEDIHLGKNARNAEVKLHMAFGPRLASVRMYSSLKQIISGWSRIFSGAAEEQAWRLCLLVLYVLISSVAPTVVLVTGLVGLALGGSTALFGSLLVLSVIHELLELLFYMRTADLTGAKTRFVVFRLAASAVLLWIFFKSIRICKTRCLTWAGTSYMRTEAGLSVTRDSRTGS